MHDPPKPQNSEGGTETQGFKTKPELCSFLKISQSVPPAILANGKTFTHPCALS